MEFSYKTLFVVSVVSVGLGLGCRPSSPSPSSPSAPTNVQADDPPELQMKNLRVQFFGETGLEWELLSPRADGYTSKDTMRAFDLDVTMFEQEQKSTHITANSGVINTAKKSTEKKVTVNELGWDMVLAPGDMMLVGDVVVISTDGARLQTEWLQFKRTQDLIVSTAPVRITRPDSVTDGVGLEATSDLSQVKIFNQTLTIKDTKDVLE